MERLPNETLDNAINVYESTLEATKGMSEDELDDYNPVLDKVIINFLKELKAYRRTGLTPEQIIAIDEEYRKIAKELGEYKRLEEQGRLIKLPCKVGDILWNIENGELESFVVEEFRISTYKIDRIEIYFENTSGFGLCLFDGTLDEGWYATKEEAEKALAEMGK